MNLLSAFEQIIKEEQLFHKKDRLLLAVSGGVDSVVLCELCRQAEYPFAIAHCNFQLRGADSDADEVLVRSLADHYGVECYVKRFDSSSYIEENRLSIQVAARELRYAWFRDLVSQSRLAATTAPGTPGFSWILTAHHADDNIETILMNFFKGSGINGIKGMLPKQAGIVRPLLGVSKEAILAFAMDNNLAYREDASNRSDKYTRNYFRNQLIPGIEKVFPQVKENLLHNAERFREIHHIYRESIEKIKGKLLTVKGNEWQLPVLLLLKTGAVHTVLYEIIKEAGFTSSQVGEAVKLLHSESGKYILSPTHRLLRNRQWLIISPLDEPGLSQYLVEEKDKIIHFPGGSLHISQQQYNGKLLNDPLQAQLDSRGISFPLLLRKWKTGDYFYPLGMPKKKKLSRFFIDQKLSINEKKQVWVIESNKKILWVVGKRIDDRFKITPSTSHTIHFRLRPSE